MTRMGLRPVSRQTRAYFAPVDRVNGATAIFDPSKDYGFQVDSPPGPWIDLAGSKTSSARARRRSKL